MSVLIAIPVFRVGCKVGIDRGRAWSVIDELVLWALTRQSKSIAALAADADLPPQIVVASIARLMRFRLVEVSLSESSVAFRASAYGLTAVSSGNPLPFYPKRLSRRVSFVIDWATGDFFPTRQVRLVTPHKLEEVRRSGVEVRVVLVGGGGPSMSHQANLNRLSDIAARGWDEQVALVDGRTATMRDDEFMAVRVIDGLPHGLPESAGPTLRGLVQEAASLPAGTTQVPVTYAGPKESLDPQPVVHACTFDPADLVVGGSAQGRCLEALLGSAHRRVIIHSTFLDAKRFAALSDVVRAACARGVTFDLLWGAELDEDTEHRNATQASEIARLVREDRDLRGRFTVHMRSTGSHAKLILLDTADDGWVAGVGSCNWLSSPFQAVELTVVLRDQLAVAEVAVALQNLVGRRGLADALATEMAITARDLRRAPSLGGETQVSLIVGEVHDRVIRTASGAANICFVVGSHRLGSTARPGAIMQGEVAAGREGVRAVVLYTQTTGPLKNRHARALAEEAQANGLMLVRTKKIPLHGKFVAWDKDDVVVTSLNWASASADPDFPWGDVGVHIRSRGLANDLISRLEAVFPEMANASAAAESV
ncbi:phosphatidylserine synthase [Methylobacterium sp. sgz302541]|uniref:phosphatidylserine synthase n=1 Tax=unclassified Methylobacterium TaxID=2615210 RepID=UPI003D354929